MQTSTIRRLPDRVAELSLKMSLPKPHADLSDRQIVPLERPPKAIKLPYGGYRGAELWPDGELRINNPVRYLDADREMLSIIEALSVLNRMGIYSAFYNYAPPCGDADGQYLRRALDLFQETGIESCHRLPPFPPARQRYGRDRHSRDFHEPADPSRSIAFRSEQRPQPECPLRLHQRRGAESM